MWFCTRDGLSRFDGSKFVTYRIGDANSPPGIENIFESRDGSYFVSTTTGVYRFDPTALAEPRNDSPYLNAERVGGARGDILEDHNGTMWVGSAGLYKRVDKDGKVGFELVDLGLPKNPKATFVIFDLEETNDGSLWMNTSWGIVRKLDDGRIVFYPYNEYITGGATTMLADRNGRIWISRSANLIVMKPEPIAAFEGQAGVISRDFTTTSKVELTPEKPLTLPKASAEIIEYTHPDLINRWPSKKLFQSSDGDVWLTAENVLLQFTESTVHLFTDAEGLPTAMARMAEDSAGNLWIGGQSALVRINRSGFITYGKQDGLATSRFYSINETADGMMYFAQLDYHWTSFDGTTFHTARPTVPKGQAPIWTSRFGYLTSDGDLWLLSNSDAYRFSDGRDIATLQGRIPTQTFGMEQGLKSNVTFQMYEDSSGDIWMSTRGVAQSEFGLGRMKKGEDHFTLFTKADGYPENRSATSFVEDAFGNLWIGFYEGGLARFDGTRFQDFSQVQGAPSTGNVADLIIDRKNRLWIGSSIEGLFEIEDPSAPNPVIKKINFDVGTVSNNIRTLTQDHFGRIYLGTARGVDRYTPDTGLIKHYSISDGLATDFIVDSHCDRNGDLWFATNDGLSRLKPLPDEKIAPPKVMIGGLRISGSPQAVSNLGTVAIDRGDLSYTDNNLQIEYLGLDFRAGESLRYQYMLEGADKDWRPVTEATTVTFANLTPGTYKFLVRAVNSEGGVIDVPATVSFTIVPPIWLRTWFVLLSALALAVVTAFVFRYRTENLREINKALREAKIAEQKLRKSREDRLAELEGVRARIATDLHDDIGASLTQIAILSEVARAQTTNGISEPLAKITDVSNELVGTMSDIVWSINPEKDHFGDLVQRMRRFASDLLTSKGLNFQFLAPEAAADIVVSSNIRREVFLIFKETVNNIVKHSQATSVRIELAVENNEVMFRITDDGVGFDPENPAPTSGGHGIGGMRERVQDLGGKLHIISEFGAGTTVSLSLPLGETAEIA
jgi:signal transduction histidine kinase/ligand-binding sensor domain-containing protein